MVLKNEKAPVFLNVNKLEIGLMNGFPLTLWLNCNPIQIGSKSGYSGINDPAVKTNPSQRGFSTGIPTGICDQSIVALVPPKRSS
jgi:hypothetical protein